MKPDEFYGVNTLSAIAWALNVYTKAKGRYPVSGTLEAILPAGKHKKFGKKGGHEIIVWITDRQVYAKARCNEDKECEFNTERINAKDREALKTIDWEPINDRRFFQIVRKMLMKMNLDYVLLIRSLTTVCDKKVKTPLTTQYGRTFEKFDEYRKNRWPEDATPDNRDKFLEEVLVRVCFWIMTAAAVDAIKT
ncbi:MAG: hypothetical protein RTU30_10270 [Candidatus Thorarchaeota archaeon]